MQTAPDTNKYKMPQKPARHSVDMSGKRAIAQRQKSASPDRLQAAKVLIAREYARNVDLPGLEDYDDVDLLLLRYRTIVQRLATEAVLLDSSLFENFEGLIDALWLLGVDIIYPR